jgi:hypothetical protein
MLSTNKLRLAPVRRAIEASTFKEARGHQATCCGPFKNLNGFALVDEQRAGILNTLGLKVHNAFVNPTEAAKVVQHTPGMLKPLKHRLGRTH